MSPIGYFIDANLLTLLVAGDVDIGLIYKHRRLGGYTSDDYRLLRELLKPVKHVYVTPNTLTEASNLLAQHREPESSALFEQLQLLIQRSEEIVIASRTASQNSEFKRLGLTDAALLEAAKPETPLLTVDLDLYLEGKDDNTAINFLHLREAN